MYKKVLIIIVLVSASFVTICKSDNCSYAQENKMIEIYDMKNKDGNEYMTIGNGEFTEPVEGNMFALFKIKGNSSIKNIDGSSLEELRKDFGKEIITEKTDKNGSVKIRNVEKGKYYIIGVYEKNGLLFRNHNVFPGTVEISKMSNYDVFVKSVNDDKLYTDSYKITNYKNLIEKKDDNIKLDKNFIININEKKMEIYTKDNVDKKKLIEKNKKEFISNRNDKDTIIKTGDIKKFYFIGLGIVLMSCGIKLCRSNDYLME